MMRRRTSGLDACRGNAQRADALLDDARLVLGRQVGERNERSRQEAEAEVVVAQGQRRAHVVGQLAHEAEDAGVAALLDAVEHHAGELEAPLLALIALKLHLAGIAVGVCVTEGDHVVGGKPAPVDHVAHGLTINAGDDATRREARVVGGAFGQHGFDDGLGARGCGACGGPWTARPASPHPEEDKCPRQHRLSASVRPYAVDFSAAYHGSMPRPSRRTAGTRRGKSAQLGIRRNCLLPGGNGTKKLGRKAARRPICRRKAKAATQSATR